ncbi:MAG: TRAP transporter large permease subunit [Pseudomonadota bacterium]
MGYALWLSQSARLLNIGSATVIAAIVLLINADVFARFLFSLPIRGAVELVALAIPATVFLSLPWLKIRNKFIRADVFADRIEKRAVKFSAALNFFFTCLAVTLTASIISATTPELFHSLKFDIYRGVEGEFAARVWPVQLIVIIGCAMLLVLECLSFRRKNFSVFFMLIMGLLAIAIGALLGFSDSRTLIGCVAIVLMFILIYLGIPVAYALLGAAVFGIAIIRGDILVAVNTLGLVATGAISSYVFAAVPLFVLLGVIVGAANIGRDALQSVHWLMGRVVGGLAVSTIVANAVFAAITGISIASAAIFSRIAAPSLIAQGYQPRFAVGLIAGSSVLGMLIPPSILLIIYGLVAEVSINALFTAAIIPGLILTLVFIGLVMTAAIIKPSFAIASTFSETDDLSITTREALHKSTPIGLLIAITLGGIYGGVFTPTEAGAVGALAALILGLVMGRLRISSLGALFSDAAESSASILILILGAGAFSIMLTLSGIPDALGDAIAQAGLGLVTYCLCYLLALILLGTILDSTSILLIMVPLALPTIIALQGDLIWFGIVTVIGVEIGLLTPPLGLSVYTIKSSLEDDTISLIDIFTGALPFVLAMLLVTVLVILFPDLSLILLQ